MHADAQQGNATDTGRTWQVARGRGGAGEGVTAAGFGFSLRRRRRSELAAATQSCKHTTNHGAVHVKWVSRVDVSQIPVELFLNARRKFSHVRMHPNQPPG